MPRDFAIFFVSFHCTLRFRGNPQGGNLGAIACQDHVYLGHITRDAAKFLRISESVVRRQIKGQRMPFFTIEGRYLFYRPVLEEWMRSITLVPNGLSTSEEAKLITNRLINKGR